MPPVCCSRPDRMADDAVRPSWAASSIEFAIIEFAILPPDARFYLTRSDTKRYNYKAVYSYSKTDL